MKRLLSILAALLLGWHPGVRADTSVAGFFPIADQGRQVWNFNPEWRFHLGDAANAEKTDFDDSQWEVVSTPHCVKLEPSEASGGRNYQGIAWYRKPFVAPANNVEVYFEAIMGKQKVYVNGQLACEHYGGYLPVMVNLGKYGVKKGDRCVVAVMADNSNDKTYPPGKPQYQLDFAYHGGIYRDVWLIARKDVYVTDALAANRQAGGGIFVHYDKITAQSAEVMVNTELHNATTAIKTVRLETTILDPSGKKVGQMISKVTLRPGDSQTVYQHATVKKPMLWSPEKPTLYRLITRVKDGRQTLDGGMTKIGIRSFEFRGKDGFWLNGQRYRQLVGANRHQDFAYVGNAVPNSQQWRDVLRLKNAGFNIIRTAHYPQDPAFMDACDELGIFIIVATPGWQYWGKDPAFEPRVLQNTRELIRRDRNHPSVLMWEPILNETPFPKDFALKSLQVTKDEYPYPYRPLAAADLNSAGVRDNYDLVFGWPGDEQKADAPRQNILTREFGEYVDDWYSHNAINRACRGWGEKAMLTQALSLAETTSTMHQTDGQFLGGCLWHPFDHQRGYHPDAYFGGIYDAFRQKKYAFEMFAAQRKIGDPGVEPMVYIAHEMTQFSDTDVVVFTNCDSVRLTTFDGAHVYTLPVQHPVAKAYQAPVIFKHAWDFWEARDLSYKRKSPNKVNMVAEGIKDGKVVCTTKRMPSRRSTKLRLYADTMGKDLVADGSDFIVVVAEVTDDSGHVRRLARESIRFTVSGEGQIIDDGTINANPRMVEWGSAPILVRSTRQAGPIHIHAEVQFPGTNAPTPADIDLTSVPYEGQFCLIQQQAPQRGVKQKDTPAGIRNIELTEEQKQKMLREVEQQQADFGIQK
ncbi:MAG: glycoside hydrolase family 2 [Prevotella sp.]|nr:glycoside hydrolase family 2 [Prevotella sp.]